MHNPVGPLAELLRMIDLGKGVFNQLWSFDACGPVLSLFCADINDDGLTEVIVPSQSGQVYALDSRGKLIWTYKANGWARSVFVGDIDFDKHDEVIIGSEDSSVHIINSNGEARTVYPVNNWARSVGCADINGDGLLEIIVGCEDGYVYAFDQSGSMIWKSNIGARVYSIFVFENVDHQKANIVVGSQTRNISLLDTDGKEKVLFTALAPIRCLSVADVDGDSNIEIIAGSEDWNIYAIDFSGNVKWVFKARDIVRTITIEDIDHDGENEIIAGGMDDYIYIIDSKGNLKWKYKADYRVRSTFAADLLNGPQKELVVGSEDGPVYVYKLSIIPNLLEKIKNVYNQCQLLGLIKNLDEKSQQFLIDLGVLVDDPKDNFVTINKSDLLNPKFVYDISEIDKLIILREFPLNFLWDYRREKRITSITSRISKSGPSIFIGSEDYTISALDLVGNVIWELKAGNQVLCVEFCIIGDQPRIMAGSADNKVLILTLNGEVLEELRQDDRVWSLHLLSLSNNKLPKLVIGSYGRQVDYIDLSTHKIEWSFHTGHWVKTVWSYDINHDDIDEILAGSYDKKIYVFNQNGDMIWNRELPDWPNALYATELSDQQDANIFVAAENGRVYAISDKGFIKWSYLAKERMQDVVAFDIDDDGVKEVIAGASDGFLYILDSVGQLKWKFYLGREIKSIDIKNIGLERYLWVGFSSGEFFAFQILNSSIVDQIIQNAINYPDTFSKGQDSDVHTKLAALENTPFFAIEFIQRNILNTGLTSFSSMINGIINSGETSSMNFLARKLGDIYIADKNKDYDAYVNFFDKLFVFNDPDIKINLLNSLQTLINNNEEEFAWTLLNAFLEDTNPWVIRETLSYLSSYSKTHYAEAIQAMIGFLSFNNAWIKEETSRFLGMMVSKHLEFTFFVIDKILINNDVLNTFELFMVSTTGISREITSSFYKILTLDEPLDYLSELIQNLINLAGLISGVHQVDTLERKDSYILLNKTCNYSKVEDLANLSTEILKFKNKYRDGNIALSGWLKDYDFSKEVTKYYGDYFEASEKGVVTEQRTALDSLVGIITRAGMNLPYCTDLLIRKLLNLIMLKWISIISEKQNELLSLARLDRVTISMPSYKVGTSVVCTIVATNIGLHEAQSVSLTIRDKAGIYNVVSQPGDSVNIPTVTSYEFNCNLLTLVPRIPRINIIIEYFDGEGRHIIDDLFEVQIQTQVTWTGPLPEFIYDEKGAITDLEKDTPFVGREELIRSLSNVETKPTIIYGPKRSGKTSILYRCLKPALENNLIPFFFSFQDLRSLSIEQFFYQVLYEHRSLGADLSGRGKGLLGVLNSFDPVPKSIFTRKKEDFNLNPIGSFFEVLREINFYLGNRHLIIFCDELEDFIELLDSEKVLVDVLSPLRATFEHYKNISFVFTASVNWTRNIGTNSILHNSFNFVDRKKVGFLSNEEAASLINDPFRDKVVYSNTAIKRAIRATGGNPYLLQKLCGRVIRTLNIRHLALVDNEIVSEVVTRMACDLDPCLTNYWGLLKENDRQMLMLKTIMPKPGQWKILDYDWMKFETISELIKGNVNDIYEDLNALVDMEYIEFSNRGGEDMYRVKIGLLSDWLYNTHQLRF